MNMNRRGFLRGIIGAGVAAVAAPALRLEPFLARPAASLRPTLEEFGILLKTYYCTDEKIRSLTYAGNPFLAFLPQDEPLFSIKTYGTLEPPSVGQERNPPRETALAAGSSPARFTTFVLREGLRCP